MIQTKKIYVKNLAGHSVAIEFKPEDKLSDLQKKIETEMAVPVDQQGLIHNGVLLHDVDQDGMTLSDFGIQRDDVLFLTLRLSGGRLLPKK